MDSLTRRIAELIPDDLRTMILQEKFIDRAVNTQTQGTPMEGLFDVYEEFIDRLGEHDDWGCFKCRQHVLDEMRLLKPALIELEFEKTGNLYT